MNTVPQTDPKAAYLDCRSQIKKAVDRVLLKGHYILGDEVKRFENEFKKFQKTRYTVSVASGTDAVEIALRACGIGHGDTVITVSHTAVATVSAIERAGGKPLFVDIDPLTFTMSPASLENLLKKTRKQRPKAVIPVHIYGHPADMPEICAIAQKYKLYVIEDCAQAHGASLHGKPAGNWGDIAAFSFYPTKNLGALGDGGMVVTNNKTLAAKAEQLRQYGWKSRYISDISGLNSRLDELQAAVLRVKLKSLEKGNKRRRTIAKEYSRHLCGGSLITPFIAAGVRHAFHQYVIRHPRRDRIKEMLLRKGIQTGIHYPIPLHLQPAYKKLTRPVPLRTTEKIAKEILSLPMFPQLSATQLKQTIRAVNTTASKIHA